MINGSKSFITIMTALVEAMTPIVDIDSNVAEGNAFRLTMCRTYWLMVGRTIVIGGENFKITEVVEDVSILVTGTAQPVGATFQLDAPGFFHGSHRKVDAERNKIKNAKAPFVYLPIFELDEDHEEDSDIAYTAIIRPLFLAAFNTRRDTTKLQQPEVIEPMNQMATFFNELVDNQDQIFNEPESIRRVEWMNFGNKVIWGNDELIFDQHLSGVELKMDLEVLDEALCLCDGKPFKICADVTETFNTAPISSIEQGGTKAIIVQTDDAIPLQTGTIKVDTPSQLIIEVVVGAGALNVKMLTGQEAKFLDTDDGDTFLTGGYANGLLSDKLTLINDNSFGSKKRNTGEGGGYLDEASGVFFDVNDVVTTKILAFPNNNLLDHHTKLKWNLLRSAAMGWVLLVPFIAGATQGGETGWRLPNILEFEGLVNHGSKVPSFIDSRLFNWSTFNMWSSTTNDKNNLQAFRLSSGSGTDLLQAKTVANGGAFVKNF